MLLIGSRAIRIHIPKFREPVDWDLIGTEKDAEYLASVLPKKSRQKDNLHKRYYSYKGAPVELVLTETFKIWQRITKILENEPTITEPVLGELIIPPASFLMLTKHCALGYPVANWHKNMAEVYLMRNYIPEIPERIAPVVALLQESCRTIYTDSHARAALSPVACHPKGVQYEDAKLHHQLHEHFKLESLPAAHGDGAWEGFPDVAQPERQTLMQRVLAEEAMTFAGHYYTSCEINSRPRSSREMKRYALRMLLTSGLPQAWRYFGVNNYREIAALIPEDFLADMKTFDHFRPRTPHACSSTESDFREEDLLP